MSKRKYNANDFNIPPISIAQVTTVMRERNLLRWGTLIEVRTMYELLHVPYLGPKHNAEKRRFEQIKTTYTNRRRKLQKHLIQVEAYCLEWVDKEQAYMMVDPGKIVNLKRSRFMRTIAGNAVNAQDTIATMKAYMDVPQSKAADKFLKEISEIERIVKG